MLLSLCGACAVLPRNARCCLLNKYKHTSGPWENARTVSHAGLVSSFTDRLNVSASNVRACALRHGRNLVLKDKMGTMHEHDVMFS